MSIADRVFDHHSDPITNRASNQAIREQVEVDGEQVTVVRRYTTDWVHREPHTADCEHAFRNADGSRTGYITLVAGNEFQNPVWSHTTVEVLGFTRRVESENPSEAEVQAAVDDVRATIAEYEAAVARTRPVAAMANAPEGQPLDPNEAEVGQTAWVHAKGKWRRGVVSKVGTKRIHVEYYVESSGTVTEKSGSAAKPVHA